MNRLFAPLLAIFIAVPSVGMAQNTQTADDNAGPLPASADATGTPASSAWPSLSLSYAGEVFSPLKGDLTGESGIEYLGLVDLTLTLETEELGWSGGELFAHGQNVHGEGISEERIGAFQELSSIEAHEFTHVGALWYRQSFGAVRVKVGRQDANREFAIADYGDRLIHSSFGMPPNVVIPAFPEPSFGISAFADVTGGFTTGGGLFRHPEGGSPLSVIQTNISMPWGGEAPGTFRLGVWHHADAAPGEESASRQNYGTYLTFDQMLNRPAEAGTSGDLRTFGQLAWAPGDRNEIELYAGAGLEWHGPLAARPEDVLAVGIAHSHLTEAAPSPSGRGETAVEATYRVLLDPGASVQPVIQYVNRNGARQYALAAGLRLTIEM